MNKESFLNDFAIRSFRDIGDYDYVSARMAYRGKLIPQFLWSGLQAIEKYLKCILLLNRIPATTIRHDLAAGLHLLEKKAPFKLRISETSRELIRHLDTYGRFRYLETPFYVKGFEIMKLDLTVWEIRRYCQVLNYHITLRDVTKEPMFQHGLKKIEQSGKRPPQHFKLFNGELENILAYKKHPARESLIWQNAFFGSRVRKKVRLGRYMHAANSPLSMHPEMLDEVLRYVLLPKDVVVEYRKHLAKKPSVE